MTRESLAGVRPRPAKAELDPQVSATQLRDVAAEALHHVTSQKAAAGEIGIHEGRLSHKLRDGSLTLGQLEALGPVFAAELGRQLTEQYSTALESPASRARRVIHTIEGLLVELKQFVEIA